ncbi:unnamed protein product [Sphagnum troendelagicum]|uniref:WRC domain-containing protein n=1 Tax=Sphagnum troendelagicum TaxID=128251 RepID=A0ABP0UAE0_9BRYO
MRIRKREAAVAEPVISLLGMGWKQVEVQEEEGRDQPHNIDGEAAPRGRAAVCSCYYNSDAMQRQQAHGDQGSCKEHELGSPVQQALQPFHPDLEKHLEKELGPRVLITSTHGGSAGVPIMTVGSAEDVQRIMSTRFRLKRRPNIIKDAVQSFSSSGATAGANNHSRTVPAAETSHNVVLKEKRKRKRKSRHCLSQPKMTSSHDNPAIKARDSLMSSLFHVFGAASKTDGLSAREAVQSIIKLGLPGLKEGGGRPSVQVANILRSSSSFLATTDKHYIFCPHSETWRERAQSQGMEPSTGNGAHTGTSVKLEELEWQQERRWQGNGLLKPGPMSDSFGIGDRKTNAAAAKEIPGTDSKNQLMESQETDQDEELGDGKESGAALKQRRRGPLVSQKGKGRTQCKRYDGRGWQCSRLTEPGYSLCEHHQDLINKRAARLKVTECHHGHPHELFQHELAHQNSKSSMEVVMEADSEEESESEKQQNRSDPNSLLNRDRGGIDVVPVHRRKMVKLLSLKAIK